MNVHGEWHEAILEAYHNHAANQVAPRRLRRSPSWSALHEVVTRKQANASDSSFVFMVKAGGTLPLYGVCCTVEEVLHRPPSLARPRYPGCTAPFRQCLISAPRVYCLLSHYPFFTLLFQVLGIMLGIERAQRSLDLQAELEADAALQDLLRRQEQEEEEDALQAEQLAQGAQGVQQQGGTDGERDPEEDEEEQDASEALQLAAKVRARRRAAAAAAAGGAPDAACGTRQSKGVADSIEEEREGDGGCATPTDPQGVQSPVTTSDNRRTGAAPVAGPSTPADAWDTGPHATKTGVRRSMTHPEGVTLTLATSASLASGHHPHPQQPQAVPGGSGAPQQQRSSSALGIYNGGGSKLSMSVDGGLLSAAGRSAHHHHHHPHGPLRLSGTGSYMLGGGGGSQDLSRSINGHHHHPQAAWTASGHRQSLIQRLRSEVLREAPSVASDLDHAEGGGDYVSNPTKHHHLLPVKRSSQGGAPPAAPSQGGPAGRASRSGDGKHDGKASSRSHSCHVNANGPGKDVSLGNAGGSATAAAQLNQEAKATASRGWRFRGGKGKSSGDSNADHTGGISCLPRGGASSSSPPVGTSDAAADDPVTAAPAQTVASSEGTKGSAPDAVGSSTTPAATLPGILTPEVTPQVVTPQPFQVTPDPTKAGPPLTLASPFLSSQSAAVAAVGSGGSAQSTSGVSGHADHDKKSEGVTSPHTHLMSPDFDTHAVTNLPQKQATGSTSTPPSSTSTAKQLHQQPHHRPTGSNVSGTSTVFYDALSPAESAHSQTVPVVLRPPSSTATPMMQGVAGTTGNTPGGFSRRRRATTRATRSSSFASTTMHWDPVTLEEEGHGSHFQEHGSHLAVQRGQGSMLEPVHSFDPELQADQPDEVQGSGLEQIAQPHGNPEAPSVPSSMPHFVLLPPPVLQPETSVASYHTAADETELGQGQQQGPLEWHSQQQGSTFGSQSAVPGSEGGDFVGHAIAHEQPHNKLAASSNGIASRPLGDVVLQPAIQGVQAGPAVHPLGPAFSPLSVLDALYDTPPSHPGEPLQLEFSGLPTSVYVRPALRRRCPVVGIPRALVGYAEEELLVEVEAWAVGQLIRSLSLDALLTVLSALLLERQLVVFHPSLPILSATVLGLLAIVRPFSWQCLVLPVLPSSMMAFLEAPTPFILGVQYKTHEVMAKCGSLVRVNLYKGGVSCPASLPALPSYKRLAATLTPLAAKVRDAHAAAPHTRPIYSVTPQEAQAVRAFLLALSSYLAGGNTSSTAGAAGEVRSSFEGTADRPGEQGTAGTPVPPAPAPITDTQSTAAAARGNSSGSGDAVPNSISNKPGAEQQQQQQVAQEAPSSTEAVHTTGAGVPQHTQSAPPALAAVQAVVSGTANGSTADVREASTLASTQAARESSVEASGGIDAAVGPGATATPAAVTTCTPATLPRSATTPNVITAAAATKQPASTAPVQPFNPRAGSTGTGSERQQPPLGLLVDLRPHIITHVDAGARRTAALMRDSLMEATPARDRPFIKAFSETQMFQVYCDQVIAQVFEGSS